MLPVAIEQTGARLTNQPGQNLARQFAGAQDRDRRRALDVLSHQAAVRLPLLHAGELQQLVIRERAP